VSETPEIKIGVLLGRPAGRQALATWALEVAPSSMLFRDPDMSLDMRLEGVSILTPDSESMAVGLSVPLGRDGAAKQLRTLDLTRTVRVAGCWQQLVRP